MLQEAVDAARGSTCPSSARCATAAEFELLLAARLRVRVTGRSSPRRCRPAELAGCVRELDGATDRGDGAR